MQTWWRRNRLWLFLLVPLALLAVAASSFRLQHIYLPWTWSRPTVGDTRGTLRQDFLGFDDVQHRRTVTVEVAGVRDVPVVGEDAAVPGAQMWRVDLRMEADPDQILDGCRVELVDAVGVRYGVEGGRRPARSEKFWMPTTTIACVPEDAPGPTIEPVSGELSEGPAPRPRTWPVTTSVVMPQGVRPVQVRIMWKEPDYLVLRVPA